MGRPFLWEQTHMNEVVKNLWLGGILSLARLGLEDNVNNIQSILSVMKGTVVVPDTFVHMQISLDDYEDDDILEHLPRSIAFIQGELDRGRRVLVHCQAGISRSPTIVAAYLMHLRGLEPEAAITTVRYARRRIYPNVGFIEQLDIFYRGGYEVSREDEATRKFYADRAAQDTIRGDSSLPSVTNNIASNSDDTSDFVTQPSLLEKPNQRILCTMCRHELATREHIVDHGKLGTPPFQFDEDHLSPQSGPHAQSSQGDGRATDTDPQRGDLESLPPPDVAGTSGKVRPIASPGPSGEFSPSNLPTTLHQSPLSGPHCSGYFLKTTKWMEFVEQGHLHGTILCSNKDCRKRVGEFDWHGLGCECGELVSPGFFISRDKVNEVA